MCPRCKSRLYDVPKIRPVVLGNGLGIEDVLGPHREEILRLARKYGATRIRVFGSVRRREARPDSDVDLLVKWSRSAPPMAWLRMPRELEKLLNRRADVGEPESLYWSVRPQVEAEAVPL